MFALASDFCNKETCNKFATSLPENNIYECKRSAVDLTATLQRNTD